MTLWVIEARYPDGSLDLRRFLQQPTEVFGMRAITGITEDEMAKAIYSRVPEAIMTGDNIANWPKLIDSRFVARPKTW